MCVCVCVCVGVGVCVCLCVCVCVCVCLCVCVGGAVVGGKVNGFISCTINFHTISQLNIQFNYKFVTIL